MVCFTIIFNFALAQYWGVPQRRRRIFLIADFRGRRSQKILFEQESLHGDTPTIGQTREEPASGIAGRIETADHGFGETGHGYWQPGINCLRSSGERPSYPSNVVVKSDVVVYPDIARTLTERYDSSPCIDRGQNIIAVKSIHQNQAGEVRMREGNGNGGKGPLISKDKSLTLKTGNDQTLCIAHGQGNAEICENLSPTLNCNHEQPIIVNSKYTVRRLTPMECERLQGFPDGWTKTGHDGKDISDSKRYAAIGNSVAIPCVDHIMACIARELRECNGEDRTCRRRRTQLAESPADEIIRMA